MHFQYTKYIQIRCSGRERNKSYLFLLLTVLKYVVFACPGKTCILKCCGLDWVYKCDLHVYLNPEEKCVIWSLIFNSSDDLMNGSVIFHSGIFVSDVFTDANKSLVVIQKEFREKHLSLLSIKILMRSHLSLSLFNMWTI